MPIIPANLSFASWGGTNPGSFRPHGPVMFFGDESVFERTHPHRNPTQRSKTKKQPLAAIRFFIGFNVGGKPKWKVEDIEEIVAEVRDRQMGDPSATFIAQHGIYKHRVEGRDLIVSEDGCQVIIMNIPFWGVPIQTFKTQMEELGEELCERLHQETIIADWQINGILDENWNVTPPLKKRRKR